MTSYLLRQLAWFVYADEGDRGSNPITIIADGTQDLAALIGLFCTDSVEAHAVDFTKGYLNVAASQCSLLGILGYVRALAKITMGLESCTNIAFSTSKLNLRRERCI